MVRSGVATGGQDGWDGALGWDTRQVMGSQKSDEILEK